MIVAGRETFFITGGTLPADASSYVERQADRDLLAGLLAGEYCYVLNTRQMGKSSLMVRTAAKLREEGVTVAILDLTAIGQNLTPEQWYDGLLASLAEQLGLEDKLEEYWTEYGYLGPLQRFIGAIRKLVLARYPRLVLFIDEIDAVRSLPFSADEFFAGLRELFTRRASDPELCRLAICLIGAATPADLVSDVRTTPFNIGRRIIIEDFTAAEASVLAGGLSSNGRHGDRLLARVLYWTDGQPYLTQSLCKQIAESPETRTADDVDRMCERVFLSPGVRESDDNLGVVRKRLLGGEKDTSSLLILYGRILAGRVAVMDEETNPHVSTLRLSGIVKTVNGRLVPRNRIFRHVFDAAWIERSVPDAELRRVKATYHANIVKGLTLIGVICVLPKLTIAASNVPYVDSYYWLKNAAPFGQTQAMLGSVLFGIVTTLFASYAALVMLKPPEIRKRDLALPSLSLLILAAIYAIVYAQINADNPAPGSVGYFRSFALMTGLNFLLAIVSGLVLYLTVLRNHRTETPATYAYIGAACATTATFFGETVFTALFQAGDFKSRVEMSHELISTFSGSSAVYIAGFAIVGYGTGAILSRATGRVKTALKSALLATVVWSFIGIDNTLLEIGYVAIFLFAASWYARQVAQVAVFGEPRNSGA